MRMPPRATAARTGMMTSRSNRERTRQFFSACLEPGAGGCGGAPSRCWPLAGAGSVKGTPLEAARSPAAPCSPVRADACSEASAAAAVRVLLLVDHTALAPFHLGPLGTRYGCGRSGDDVTCLCPAGNHRA